MSDDHISIGLLNKKLTDLMKRQESFQDEIEKLRLEINTLRLQEVEPESRPTLLEMPIEPLPEIHYQDIQQNREPVYYKEIPIPEQDEPQKIFTEEGIQTDKKFNIEKFIGENLINKLGIGILVIGVGIGAKYAIDNQLISPLTRIILGYLLGIGLLGFAIRLRKEYENFSAVLLSGSMAIFYFITFAAYSFYSLIPLIAAFILMVLFTVFTVASAISYNRQVIAHIGLVGAYAVPFLLSDGSGRVVVLFSYMAIINAGILVIAFRKYWKFLYYASFLLTWLIFLTWFIEKYDAVAHFELSWIFISIFFVTFYVISLAYKLLKKEKFEFEDIIMILTNSFIFYGVGYSILHQSNGGEDFKGLFTLCNALIHLTAVIIIFRQKLVDRNLFYFTAGLALAFFTIAIPVQLDGNWVTLLWTVEAVVFFWIGRTRNIGAYELFSYALMILAFFSLIIGWPAAYHSMGTMNNETRIIPLFNINFLTSVLFVVSFAFINILNANKQIESPLQTYSELRKIINFFMPAILLIVCYLSFYMEIVCYWNQLFTSTMVIPHNVSSTIQPITNDNIPEYKTLSVLIYSLFFFSMLSFVNIWKLKKSLLGFINLGFNAITIGLFLFLGLFALGALRDTYLSQVLSEYFYRGSFTIGIRYVSFMFLALTLFAFYTYIHQEFLATNSQVEFDFILHISVLTIASNELINWMDLFHSEQSYKLGLSILFGVYALLLIVLGIWKKKLHLRIGAIALFSITLIKLFFYDLTYLNTISKTIVFVVLGLLLLIISFLYNKYKKTIF